MIFRWPGVMVVVLMFYSGKIVLTGARSLADIEHGWGVIWDLIKHYVVRKQ
jgi:TATA-box binding protein (TBP) (component of TFIID and TFIIIB)